MIVARRKENRLPITAPDKTPRSAGPWLVGYSALPPAPGPPGPNEAPTPDHPRADAWPPPTDKDRQEELTSRGAHAPRVARCRRRPWPRLPSRPPYIPGSRWTCLSSESTTRRYPTRLGSRARPEWYRVGIRG